MHDTAMTKKVPNTTTRARVVSVIVRLEELSASLLV